MEKDVQQIRLFDEEFDQNSKKGGVLAGFLEKENEAKLLNNGKRLSASERAKRMKSIQKLVKEAENKPGELSTAEVLEVGRKIMQEQGYFASFSDLENDHQIRRWPTEKNLRIWAQNPGKSDLLGVDNAKKNDATVGFNRGLFFMLPLID